jgi:hypothetical protein
LGHENCLRNGITCAVILAIIIYLALHLAPC